MVAVLRDRTVQRILTTSAASNFADGVFLLALPLAAAQSGADPFWMGLILAALRVWWLLSIPLSTIVDRIGPGPLLLRVRPLRIGVIAAVAAGVYLVEGQVRLICLLVLAAAWGLLEVLADAAAHTLPALLIPQETYDAAYSLLYSVQRITNNILGPAAAGILALNSSWLPFCAAAVFLLVSYAIQLPLLRRPEVQPDAVPVGAPGGGLSRLRSDLSGGWRHIMADPFLRSIMVTLTGIVVGAELVEVVMVPYVRDAGLIPRWEQVLGMLHSFAGLAAVLAALGAGLLAQRFGRLRILGLAALGAVLAPLILSVRASTAFVMGALLVSTVAESLWVPLVQAEVVRRTPKPVLARTRATLMFVTWGTLPLAGLTGGVLAQWLGVPTALRIAAGAAALSSVCGIWRVAFGGTRR